MNNLPDDKNPQQELETKPNITRPDNNEHLEQDHNQKYHRSNHDNDHESVSNYDHDHDHDHDHNHLENDNLEDDKNFGMSFLEHLTELRQRLLRTLIVVAVVFLGLVGFAQDIYTFVAEPVLQALPTGTEMIATEITSTLFAPLKLTFFLALILAMPMILHQAWSFIAPGLYKHEKRIAIPLLLSSIILFYLGIAFAYILVLPILMSFFAAIGPEGVAFMPDIQHYLNMVMKLFFAFGLAFEIPVALMLLIWSGVVARADIQSKRSYVVVGCFIVAMLLTPPDIFSQTLLAIPMWLLFELGLVMAGWLKLEQKNPA